VNPVSIGHFTSLVATQNGHVILCGTSFALLYGPETVNVFLHFMQVMIFSKPLASRTAVSIRPFRLPCTRRAELRRDLKKFHT
jgi:hypothetical protein